MKNIKAKVEEALTKDEQSRNSDIRCTNYILINHFQGRLFKDKDGDWAIKLKELYNVPSIDDVKRIRALFNSKGKYLPTSKTVAKQRRINEEEWRRNLGYDPGV